MKTSRQDVYEALDGEREYQRIRALASGKIGEAQHSVEEFVVYMQSHLTQAIEQLSRTWTADGTVPEALNTIRKITALGVACMEQHGAPKREGV